MRPTQRPRLGIALIVLMGVCFAGMDTSIKYAGRVTPVLLMLWVRYAFQASVMALWLMHSRRAGFRAAHLKFQWLRGTLLLVTSAMSFFGVQHMPVPVGGVAGHVGAIHRIDGPAEIDVTDAHRVVRRGAPVCVGVGGADLDRLFASANPGNPGVEEHGPTAGETRDGDGAETARIK